jgi:hypothetical protein
MEATLIEHRQEIVALCRLHGVWRLEVFGSAADGSFDPLSKRVFRLVARARFASRSRRGTGRR